MLELILAVFKTGSAAIANLLVSAITVKIIAMITGPMGVGAWSLLRQCQQSAVIIGTCNGSASFVRGMSQLAGKERAQFMRTVATTYLVLGLCVTMGIIVLSARLATWIGTLNAHIFSLLAIPVAVGILRDYLMGLLNGLRAIGRLALVQIIGTVASVTIAYPVALLIVKSDFSGFVFLMLVVGLTSSFAAIYFIRRADWDLNIAVRPYWTLESFRRFVGLAGVMATTGIFGTVTLFAVRVLIARYNGINETGFFDVSWSLGLMYVGLLLNAFGTYYLPRLSAMTDQEQINLIRHVAKLTIIAMTPLIVLLIIVKPWVISVFYSNEFLPALEIFQWLLIADYLKMSAWVFSIVVVARGMEKPLLIGGILWDAGLLLGVWLALQFNFSRGAIGFVILVLHGFSLIGYYRLISQRLAIRFTPRLWRAWAAGLLCVICATIMEWNATQVDLLLCWVPLSASLIVSWACLDPEDVAALRRLFKNNAKGENGG